MSWTAGALAPIRLGRSSTAAPMSVNARVRLRRVTAIASVRDLVSSTIVITSDVSCWISPTYRTDLQWSQKAMRIWIASTPTQAINRTLW